MEPLPGLSLLFHLKVHVTPGPRIRIDCPQCHAAASPAESCEQTDYVELLHFLPLLTVTNRWITCSRCGAELKCDLPLEELGSASPAELRCHLRPYDSLVARFLAVASLLLFFFPIVGLMVTVPAVILTRKSGGWARPIALVGLGLSILAHLAILALCLLEWGGLI